MLLELGILFVAAYASGVTVKLLAGPARFYGWLDVPSERKRHHHVTPITGGLAMATGLAIALYMYSAPVTHYVLLLSMLLMTVFGFLDDRFGLRPLTRLVVQAGVAWMLCGVTGVQIHSLGNLLGTGEIILAGPWSMAFTVFAIVGMINAINMTDGVDGLAGSLTLVTLIAVSGLALAGGSTDLAFLAALLAAAVVGFLFHNLRTPWRRRAAAFMGDGGSTMLGLAVGWFLVAVSQSPGVDIAPPLVLWLIAVPLLDTLALMVARALNGRNPVRPDRHHLHHRLLEAGMPAGAVTATLTAAAIVLLITGLAAHQAGATHDQLFYGFMILFTAHFLLLMRRIWIARHTTAEAG